jgi:predicted TPR repeat methyltransferase
VIITLTPQDRKEAAIEDCTKAIELKPDYVKALVRRGQAYEDTDKPHEAFKDFERVLEIDPGLKEARAAVLVSPGANPTTPEFTTATPAL